MGYQPSPSFLRRKKLSAVKLKCPAKINLYLNILGKYRNGFHKLESIVTRVSLFDELKIVRRDDSRIFFDCDKKWLESEDNLCVKAAVLFRREAGLKQGVSLSLKKNIPVGAGMGGGSADAAYTLLGMNRLFNEPLSPERLYVLGSRLGSDVNFFLSQSTFAYIYGRGEKVIPIKSSWRPRYIIVSPDTSLSTKSVYSNTKVKLTKFLNNVNIIFYAINKRDYALLNQGFFNVLTEGAFRVSRYLRKHRPWIEEKQLIMTGSGSSFFCLPDNSWSGRGCLNRFFHEDWLVSEVRSI